MKSFCAIIPMERAHLSACKAIVARSEPWQTLGEGIDFKRCRALKQAYVCLAGPRGRAEVMGFVIFTAEPVFARGGYLRAIGVSPEARRNGIGTALLFFAETMTARKCGNIYLCVSSFNRQAQLFYKKRGYVRAGKLPGLVTPEETEYIYWKRLRPAVRQ